MNKPSTPSRTYNLSLTDKQMKMVNANAPTDARLRYDYLLFLETELKLTRRELPSDALLECCIRAALERCGDAVPPVPA